VRPHGGPVVGDQPYLREHLSDSTDELVDQLGSGDADRWVHDERHPGLGDHHARGPLDKLTVSVPGDAQLRVEHMTDRPVLPGDLHRHGVDEERPVMGDDLEQSRPRQPPCVGRVRSVGHDAVSLGGPVSCEPHVGIDDRRQVVGTDVVQVVAVLVLEVPRDQASGRARPAHGLRIEPGDDLSDHPLISRHRLGHQQTSVGTASLPPRLPR